MRVVLIFSSNAATNVKLSQLGMADGYKYNKSKPSGDKDTHSCSEF